MSYINQKKIYIPFLVFLLIVFIECNTSQTKQSKSIEPEESKQLEQIKEQKELIHKIKSNDEFKNIFENSGKRLLVIDLYADWCKPCKLLAPILEEIAKEHSDGTDFYKVNIDELKSIAALFGVQNIPYVVFLKEKKVVQSIIGLYPKEKYINIINQFSEKTGEL